MLVLASASLQRKILLEQIRCSFKVIVSQWEEEEATKSNFSPSQIALKNAYGKASEVFFRTDKKEIVIGADTVVYCNQRIFGKPKSAFDAIETLKFLSGKKHTVISGISVISQSISLCEFEETNVYLRELSFEQIENYVATNDCFGKAGAYGIQSLGALLIEKIEGCYNNVVGLPLVRLESLLRKTGINLL